ncbi:MAG: hypothetical protein PHP01_03840 [Phycisphaerae bacterium]|nr:hypothetical protein [Phycisphaerae bacterium]
MSIEDKETKKGFFAKLCEFFNGFEGSGCACNCLKTVWEKYAKEKAENNSQSKSESNEH